jgi:REP element-mobilizing transposase RayT
MFLGKAMSKREIVFLPGQYYHIYNRGANRNAIFHCDDNYLFLLKRIKQCAAEYEIAMIAYCLMPNHYHFVLRQESEKQISAFVQAIFNSYTKAFNKMYQRTGTLFEERFRAIAIEKFDYLLHLCRYVHRNPLEAGLVTHPAQWQYSNYLEWMRQRNGTLVDKEFVQEHFPDPIEYEEFVMMYNSPKKIDKDLQKLMFD